MGGGEKRSRRGGGGGGGGRAGKEDRTSVGLKTSHESEMAATAGGGGFG